MINLTYLAFGVALGCVLMVSGCAPRRALRPTRGYTNDPPDMINKSDAWYIQSAPSGDHKPISCSFIEFDERGDYYDFQQHRHAYAKIKDLSKNKERLFVVIYVHGWKNNSQSGDVVEFNSFLKRVASSPMIKEGGYRVHGVYLAWRGNSVPHALDKESPFFVETKREYGDEPIVNLDYARKEPFGWMLWPSEQFSYWSRKNAAEDKVSGISLIRTIYTLGYAAKRYSNTNSPNAVVLMGHSLGALMLEQSFAPASLALLTSEWPWDDKQQMENARSNPLPFDLVLLVNSAAPSIYAKQFYGYMVAHRKALLDSHVAGADAPLVISLTSTADWATGKVHPWANLLAPLYPSLWREYDGGNFILATNEDTPKIEIPQSYYYRRTPGHNPLLVNHWIVPAKDDRGPAANTSLFHQNMEVHRTADSTRRTFYTSPRHAGGPTNTWEITDSPPDPKWSSYHGVKPISVAPHAVRSGYWIVRCQKEIISGHNDIWSQQAMETYAALLAEVEFLRKQKPEQTPQSSR